MRYKLLALDIDGTLTNSKKEITSFTRQTLHRLQENGLRIALASGRPAYGVGPVAETLELGKYDGFILSFNGGRVEACGTGEVIREYMLPARVIGMPYTLAKSDDVSIVTYRGRYVISENPENPYVQKEAAIRAEMPKE